MSTRTDEMVARMERQVGGPFEDWLPMAPWTLIDLARTADRDASHATTDAERARLEGIGGKLRSLMAQGMGD